MSTPANAEATKPRRPAKKADVPTENAGETVKPKDTETLEPTTGDTQPMTETQMIDGIEIEVMAIPARGAKIKPEEYPFSKIPVSAIGEGGAITGPSFFIAESAGPEKHLTQARKQVRKHDGKPEFLFHARVATKKIDDAEVSGKRIWKTANDEFKG